MSNVQITLSVEEYNALTSEIEDYKKELMGPEKYDLFMELSDEAKEMMNRPKPKTKLIDLRTGKVVEE